jgi:hypothetical protein
VGVTTRVISSGLDEPAPRHRSAARVDSRHEPYSEGRVGSATATALRGLYQPVRPNPVLAPFSIADRAADLIRFRQAAESLVLPSAPSIRSSTFFQNTSLNERFFTGAGGFVLTIS